VILAPILIDENLSKILFCQYSSPPYLSDTAQENLKFLLTEFRDINHLLWKYVCWRAHPQVLGIPYAEVWEKRMGYKTGFAVNVAQAARATAEKLKCSPPDVSLK